MSHLQPQSQAGQLKGRGENILLMRGIFLEVFHAVTRGLDSAYLKPRVGGATQPSEESGIRLFLLKTDRAPIPIPTLCVSDEVISNC